MGRAALRTLFWNGCAINLEAWRSMGPRAEPGPRQGLRRLVFRWDFGPYGQPVGWHCLALLSRPIHSPGLTCLSNPTISSKIVLLFYLSPFRFSFFFLLLLTSLPYGRRQRCVARNRPFIARCNRSGPLRGGGGRGGGGGGGRKITEVSRERNM